MAPFCSCPASLVSRKFFAVGPGCAKCFFFVALRWAPRPFGGARAKKKHHPGCFFFCSGPGERQGKEKPRAGTGPEQKKKHHPGCFFFLLRPRGKAREGEAPLGAGTGPEQKKKHHPGVFFLLQPRGKAGEGEAPLGAGTVVFFFLLWPRAGAQRGFSFPCLSPGPEQKKKTPWVVFFFFAAAPRGRSLTHCGPGWRCLPLAGVVFVFLLRGGAGPGWCFFFLLWPRPDAHSLTVGWGDFGKARVVFFFLLRPRRVFLDNNKVWGTTSGLKRPGGATAKKKTPLPLLSGLLKQQSNE